MTNEEKAKIILEHLDEYIQVNWSLEKFYIKAIVNGLKKIEQREKEENEEI
ncbi:hypothetical protein [Caenibacillus caldisaponilyticus]|uniref:hypothetical protein n=1 Tax=Caenibacillus caldisaponilyticus TaxID=1674942 RepID=UPI0013010723|nr:hypothetical protein [Caenibacillus caldisaponilyticus]